MNDAARLEQGGHSPYTNLLGVRFTAAGKGTSRCELTVGPRFHNMRGLVHGGVTFSLVDTAMGAALPELLEENEMSVTLEIQIAYLQRVKDGELACEARVIRKARRVIFLEAEVTQDAAIVARATGTYAITSRQPATPPDPDSRGVKGPTF